MKFNRKYLIVAMMVMGLTLTSCNNNNNKEDNKSEAPMSESVETMPKEEDKAKDDKDAKKDEEVKEDMAESTESTETAEEEQLDLSNMSQDELLQTLEDKIFENRVQARAAEILMEKNPAAVENFRDDLETLLQESNDLCDRGEAVLQELGGTDN